MSKTDFIYLDKVTKQDIANFIACSVAGAPKNDDDLRHECAQSLWNLAALGTECWMYFKKKEADGEKRSTEKEVQASDATAEGERAGVPPVSDQY